MTIINPFNNLHPYTSETPKVVTPTYTPEDLDNIVMLIEAAKQNGHTIMAVSSDLQMYSPALTPPEAYDVQAFGDTEINYRELFANFTVDYWIDKNGNRIESGKTIKESGIITNYLLWSQLGDVDFDVLDQDTPFAQINAKSREWLNDLKGTRLGLFLEYILTLDPQIHTYYHKVPLHMAQEWSESTFDLEEAKKWIQTLPGVYLDDIRIILEGGFTRQDAGRVIDESGTLLGYKLLCDEEFGYEEARRLLDENTIALLGIYPLAEAALIWQMSSNRLKSDIETSNPKFQELLRSGLVRKTRDGSYLLHHRAMQEIYGTPQAQ